jgi:hypothetical protein
MTVFNGELRHKDAEDDDLLTMHDMLEELEAASEKTATGKNCANSSPIAA